MVHDILPPLSHKSQQQKHLRKYSTNQTPNKIHTIKASTISPRSTLDLCPSPHTPPPSLSLFLSHTHISTSLTIHHPPTRAPLLFFPLITDTAFKAQATTNFPPPPPSPPVQRVQIQPFSFLPANSHMRCERKRRGKVIAIGYRKFLKRIRKG